MKLEQQVTSLEVSKRLKELGVKQESYFYWWTKNWTGRDIPAQVMKGSSVMESENCIEMEGTYSAFTVAELGEMLPDTIEKGSYKAFFGVEKTITTDSLGDLHIWEVFYVYSVNEKDRRIGFTASSEADARGKMLIYLLENNLIKI